MAPRDWSESLQAKGSFRIAHANELWKLCGYHDELMFRRYKYSAEHGAKVLLCVLHKSNTNNIYRKVTTPTQTLAPKLYKPQPCWVICRLMCDIGEAATSADGSNFASVSVRLINEIDITNMWGIEASARLYILGKLNDSKVSSI